MESIAVALAAIPAALFGHEIRTRVRLYLKARRSGIRPPRFGWRRFG